jgi:hypothetical protein
VRDRLLRAFNALGIKGYPYDHGCLTRRPPLDPFKCNYCKLSLSHVMHVQRHAKEVHHVHFCSSFLSGELASSFNFIFSAIQKKICPHSLYSELFWVHSAIHWILHVLEISLRDLNKAPKPFNTIHLCNFHWFLIKQPIIVQHQYYCPNKSLEM